MGKMTFTDYYKNLPDPKRELIERIATVTFSSTDSVRKWVAGKVVPPKVKQDKIAEELNIPMEVLFPEKSNN